MKREDKELLLRDLCGRLPYGVKMNHIANNEHSPNTLIGIAKDMITLEGLGGYECVDVEHYKPYLFPLSSMTEEQRNELKNLLIPSVLKSLDEDDEDNEDTEFPTLISANPSVVEIDYYNKNNFDYRGLIEKDLAIDCTKLNIY